MTLAPTPIHIRLSKPPAIFLDAFAAFEQELMARIIAMGTLQSVERERSLAVFSSSTFSFVGYKCTALAAAAIQAASPTCSLDLEVINAWSASDNAPVRIPSRKLASSLPAMLRCL
jgi:hypothetical protein